MRKLLLVALTLAVAALLVVVFFPRGGGPHGGPFEVSQSFWPWGIALVVILGIGAIAALAYSTIYPEIPTTSPSSVSAPPKDLPLTVVDTFEGVLRVLEPEEQQVCKALRNSGSFLTQKEICNTTGFSKVKTHRIVSRLASRRVVTVEKAGKVNRVRLAEWVTKSREPPG